MELETLVGARQLRRLVQLFGVCVCVCMCVCMCMCMCVCVCFVCVMRKYVSVLCVMCKHVLAAGAAAVSPRSHARTPTHTHTLSLITHMQTPAWRKSRYGACTRRRSKAQILKSTLYSDFQRFPANVPEHPEHVAYSLENMRQTSGVLCFHTDTSLYVCLI